MRYMIRFIAKPWIDLSKNDEVKLVHNYVMKKWSKLEPRSAVNNHIYYNGYNDEERLTIIMTDPENTIFIDSIVKYIERYKNDKFVKIFDEFGLIVFKEIQWNK